MIGERKERNWTDRHTLLENGAMHPNYPEYKVDVYQLNNEINWYTGKARIKGDIWLEES